MTACPAPCRVARPAARHRVLVVLALGLGLASLAPAAELTPVARKEIDGLLVAVGTSGCEFARSGKWHAATAAQAHLQQKYDYLAMRGKLGSAEDFIVMAGSRSSMTGEAYGIRCGGNPQQPSEDWLRARLKDLRATQPPR